MLQVTTDSNAEKIKILHNTFFILPFPSCHHFTKIDLDSLLCWEATVLLLRSAGSIQSPYSVETVSVQSVWNLRINGREVIYAAGMLFFGCFFSPLCVSLLESNHFKPITATFMCLCGSYEPTTLWISGPFLKSVATGVQPALSHTLPVLLLHTSQPIKL